jgi:hypothetical protein
MTVGPKQERHRDKRREKARLRLARATQRGLSAEVSKHPPTGALHVVGTLRGQRIYTSKALRTANYAAAVKIRWLRHMSKRMMD